MPQSLILAFYPAGRQDPLTKPEVARYAQLRDGLSADGLRPEIEGVIMPRADLPQQIAQIMNSGEALSREATRLVPENRFNISCIAYKIDVFGGGKPTLLVVAPDTLLPGLADQRRNPLHRPARAFSQRLEDRLPPLGSGMLVEREGAGPFTLRRGMIEGVAIEAQAGDRPAEDRPLRGLLGRRGPFPLLRFSPRNA